MNDFVNYIDISDEVLDALRFCNPVVALESAIISMGMPYPDNVNTAIEIENIIRKNGAVPATLAIIDGRIKIGLSPDEIEFMATSKKIIKASRRDIPYLLATEQSGAATVSSTMIFAEMAGIRVMATGGIGGVHRGAEISFDVSADLIELSKTEATVVCSGVKSILDIGLTLEKLETLGVPVLGYQTDEFPSFYTRKSGYMLENRVDTPAECAKVMKVMSELDFKSGIIVANPIPLEYEADHEIINNAIKTALLEVNRDRIKGKHVTPYLLSKVKELTKGESLDANKALIKSNAALAAKIAVEYYGLLDL